MSIETDAIVVLLTRGTALCMMVAWILSWLAPELVRTSPVGSLFDQGFRRIARHRRALRLAALAFGVAHAACACAETGFLVHGWHTERLAQVWMVPAGETATYNVVVGLPCSALGLLALTTLVPRLGAAYPLLSAALVFGVLAICYIENMFYMVATWEADLRHVAGVAYYMACTLVLLHAVMLFRIVRKKPTVQNLDDGNTVEKKKDEKKNE